MTAVNYSSADDIGRFPLIVFVHVPKTAGSTVNKYLWFCSQRGHEHCEVFERSKLIEIARDDDWLSGHLPRDSFASFLLKLDRPIEYFSIVRDPISQLVSHLNWQFEIYARGPKFFSSHPAKSQSISNEVRATDFSKASSIIEMLLRNAKPFLNMQASIILGADFKTISESEIVRRITSYSYIGTDKNLTGLFRAFGFAKLPEQKNELRENVAQNYHFDTNIFRSGELLDFLAHHHQHDYRLYAYVSQASWSTEGRLPFRTTSPKVAADTHLNSVQGF